MSEVDRLGALASLVPQLGQLLTGEESYLVGGYVRDRLLGRIPREIDLVVAGSARQIGRRLADALGGAYYPLDEARHFGRVLLVHQGLPVTVDVALLQGPDLEADLARRDFTINAMALPLTPQGEGGRLIDPHRGRDDLLAHILRPVAPDVFQRDPVRLLRAVRLAAELGFHLGMRVEAMIRAQATLLAHASRERAHQELALLLGLPRAAAGAERLVELGLAEVLLPGALPRPEHALGVLAALETLAPDTAPLPAMAETLPGGQSRWVMLKLAALVHHAVMDSEPGVERRKVEALVLSLRFSREEAAACALPASAMAKVEETVQEGLPRRKVFRLLALLGPHATPTFLLWGAHHLAEVGEGPWHSDLLQLLEAAEDSSYRPQPLLSGDELMQVLSLEPGPSVGWLLTQLQEAQVEGSVRTQEEALDYARRLLEQE